MVISTRHNLHAGQVLAALAAGKSVFCEKPLCLNEDELAANRACELRADPAPLLVVGFNRRFAPMAVQLEQFLSEIQEPLAIHYRVNAGYIPGDHWVNDPEQGGGRILGEACHFVDFLCFLAGACPVEVQGQIVGNPGQYSMDNVIATLKFANGTVGTISYLANGDKSASKERVEVFGGGSTAILEDFRRLELIRQREENRLHALGLGAGQRPQNGDAGLRRRRVGAKSHLLFRLSRSSAQLWQPCGCRTRARSANR